jgi:hypothetical protein
MPDDVIEKLVFGQAVAGAVMVPALGCPAQGIAGTKVIQPTNPRGAKEKVAEESLGDPAALALAVLSPPLNRSQPPEEVI